MDFDLDDHLSKLPRKPYKDGWKEETWEEELERNAFFMTKAPTEEDIEASPTLSAMQALKYQEDDPEELAMEHKEDGNHHFKKKLYKFAIKSYTEGLKQKCENAELKAILYTNRAASHFHIENYSSSLEDAKQALKLKPDHLKAIYRCVDCCMKLSRYSEVIQHCDNGLKIFPEDKKLLEKRAFAVKEKKAQERDERKRKLQEKRIKAEHEKLLAEIKERNIQLRISPALADSENKPANSTSGSLTDDDILKSLGLDSISKNHVILDDSGTLNWPVRFLYPECNQSDLISAFNENSRFSDHFKVMFDPDEDIPWDETKAYTLDNLEIYFEDYDRSKLVKFNPDKTLREILQDKRCHVYHGTPSFLVLSRATPFRDEYLKQYGGN